MDPDGMYMERLASRAEAAQVALAEHGINVDLAITRSGSTVTEITIDLGIEGYIAFLEAVHFFVEERQFEADWEEMFGEIDFTPEDFESWGDLPEEDDE